MWPWRHRTEKCQKYRGGFIHWQSFKAVTKMQDYATEHHIKYQIAIKNSRIFMWEKICKCKIVFSIQSISPFVVQKHLQGLGKTLKKNIIRTTQVRQYCWKKDNKRGEWTSACWCMNNAACPASCLEGYISTPMWRTVFGDAYIQSSIIWLTSLFTDPPDTSFEELFLCQYKALKWRAT